MRLDDRQRTLALSRLKLARGAARKIKRGFPRLADDFESAACLALCLAASTWDPGSPIPFDAWAYSRCRRAVWGVLEAHRRDRLRPADWLDGRPTPLPTADECDGRDAFLGLLGRLPARLARVLDLTYREGLNRRETAERIGTDQPYASRLHAEALARLRRALTAPNAGDDP